MNTSLELTFVYCIYNSIVAKLITTQASRTALLLENIFRVVWKQSYLNVL
jgi:hypothetical protein